MRSKVSLLELTEFDNKAKAKGFRFLFGVDEAGRGPLAGPVVAAAVCIRDEAFNCRIADSKLLSPLQRDRAFAEIQEKAWVGVGQMSEKVIDEVNILRAAHMAMAQAVMALVAQLPQEDRQSSGFSSTVGVLIDGNSFSAALPYKVGLVIGGDKVSLSIACASIVAKVTRDRIIQEYDVQYPQYGFKGHKGYPTAAHYEAIKTYGPCPIHRRSFRLF